MRLSLINPKVYLNEFKQLKRFVVNPVYIPNHDLTITQKIQRTWAMFVVKMVLAVIVGVTLGLIYDPENITSSSMSERFSPAALFFISVLLLPLVEEVAFRLSLIFKPLYLALTLGALGYYIASKAIYFAKLSDIHDNFEPRILISLGMIVISYPLLSQQKIKEVLELFWKRNFRGIIYTSSFAFAWIHILNYELSLEHLLLMPIITLPKLVNALCYGYARVNYGFLYSFAIHILTNGLGFAVSLMSGSD